MASIKFENKTIKQSFVYEIIMVGLAAIAAILAIVDLMNGIPDKYYSTYIIVDWVIILIFAVDYFYRFFKSENKVPFIKENVFDLLAIMPFNSLFRGFRAIKIVKLLKIFRIGIFSKRLSKKANSFLDTNGFIYVLWLSLISITAGSILIYFVEKMPSMQDAFWWSFVTTTTVGYGDISPSTTFGRVIAACLMIVGIGFISMLTGTIATFFLNKNKSSSDKLSFLDEYTLTDSQKVEVENFIKYLKYIEKEK